MKYYSAKTVTQILGVTAQTLRNWDKEGKLKPSYTKSNGYRYYSEYDRWVKLYFNGNVDDKNKTILDLTNVEESYLQNPNFSYLATFLPIVNYDINL